MQDTLRAFVALALPSESMDLLTRLQKELKGCGLKMSWVKPQNLHLTLKFLGDIPALGVPAMAKALQQTAARHSPLNLILQGMGVFPGIKRPKVLWAGLGGDTDQLGALWDDVEKGLAPLGFSRDKRAFRAHITLSRIRKRIDPHHLLRAIEDVGHFAPKKFMARRLVLFKSDLQPRGAVYTPLAEVVLT